MISNMNVRVLANGAILGKPGSGQRAWDGAFLSWSDLVVWIQEQVEANPKKEGGT